MTTTAPAECAPYRLAPIEDQIAALERAQQRMKRWHAKILTGGQRVNVTWNRLEEWRIESALRTLRGLRPAGGAS